MNDELALSADVPVQPSANEQVFRRLVLNTLVSGVTSSFLWFAVTFWVYLETRSVVATGVIGAAYGLSSALLGPWFGDPRRRRWPTARPPGSTCVVRSRPSVPSPGC